MKKLGLIFGIIIAIIIYSFSGKKNKKNELTAVNSTKVDLISFEEQIKVFKSLGYEFANGVTKEIILTDGYAKSVREEIKRERLQEIEQNPFSRLYFYFGWRNPEIKNFNFSDKCIWFDLEFIDPSDQYIWFMERMGTITNGEIKYSEVSIQIDENNYEWIIFKANGINKKWKLEKVGYISDSFFQRFSYLPAELNTNGKYTYYDDGGQQFVIDYATESEQKEFNEKTGLKREWLGEGSHFSEPKD
ncbi:hypothetical protein ACFO3O_06130 [Dokdonia ponticola]|uniref:GLPGLI family protein n=1 Tax=Dokdonia ponticola TaxID=2041041 RepID=A0ABV9HVC1_9FLAO